MNGNNAADDYESTEPVADDFFGLDPPKRVRGRPEGISDTALAGSRGYLLYVAATSWPEIVLNLRRLRTPADVPAALRAWEQHRTAHPLIDALFRDSARPTSTKQLRVLEQQRTKQLNLLDAADERRRRFRASFEKISLLATQLLSSHELPQNRSPEEQASTDELAENQKALIDMHWVRRASAWGNAEIEHQAEKKKHDDLLEDIKQCQSYLAKRQLVQFCRGKYAKNPFNLANALAGWPYIEYRRSIERCRKWEADNGVAFRIIGLIRRILGACNGGSNLVDYAESWLRTRSVSKSDKNFVALTELGENFHYLKTSIEAVVATKPRTNELPERITAEYYRRYAARSSLDNFLAEETRIVIKYK
jgi:hypothetical protein